MGNIRRFRIYDGRLDDIEGDNIGVAQGLPHGRDTTQVPCWFDQRSGQTRYITCSFIRIFINNADIRYLVWPYSPDTMVEAHYDYDQAKIVIDRHKGVKHIAWYCGDRTTLLKSWVTGKVPGVKPKLTVWALACPSDYDTVRCRSIPELPLIDSSDAPAPKSTEMFDVCVDIPALPSL